MTKDWIREIGDTDKENQSVDWEQESREILLNGIKTPEKTHYVNTTETKNNASTIDNKNFDSLKNEVQILRKTVAHLQLQIKRQQKRETAYSVTEFCGDLSYLDMNQLRQIEDHLREFVEINTPYIKDAELLNQLLK
ncbi:MAG: hypothetical protein [Siphoviridae sp. ctjeG17]|nr:MAG: hypothetical protein [Siphoviridae sp. ctjeG17]